MIWRYAVRAWQALRRSRIVLAIRARTGRRRFVRSVYGPYLRDTPGDFTFQLCVGGYGRFISDAIRHHDREFVFIDIGANCGVFALAAAAHPLCRQVIAIEPVPPTFAALQANIAFNRAGKVCAVRMAVCEEAGGELHLSYDARHSGMSAITEYPSAGTMAAPALDAGRLDELVGSPGCSVFIKIDVEGSEAGVLAVLRRCTFLAAVSDIVIEISERTCGEDGIRVLLATLDEMGFREYGRAGPSEHYDAHYRR